MEGVFLTATRRRESIFAPCLGVNPRELKQALQNRIANILGQPQGRTRRARELELLKEQIRKITMQEG